jgi:orotate phosphoribosyltransferase
MDDWEATRETMRVVEQAGGRVEATGALIDRSGGRLDLPVPARALATLKVETFDPTECPFCRAGSAAVKPGSHFVRAGA